MFAMITNDDNDYVNVYPWSQNINILSITQSKTYLIDAWCRYGCIYMQIVRSIVIFGSQSL